VQVVRRVTTYIPCHLSLLAVFASASRKKYILKISKKKKIYFENLKKRFSKFFFEKRKNIF